LSIDGFRLIGAQDADYAGQVGPFWTLGAEGPWTDIPPDGPIYAAKVGIKHKNGATTWGVAKYRDYEAGPLWKKFPSTMVSKCAEMLAWRKAFPGKLGGLYGVEEMAQVSKEAAKPDAKVTDTYSFRIKNILSKEALIALGKEIRDDKALSVEEVMKLHMEYTEAKRRYDG